MLCLGDGLRAALEEDECIIRVLEHRTGGKGNQRTLNGSGKGRVVKKTTEDVGDNDEEIWGERVALAKTVPIGNPTPRDAVKEDSSLASAEKITDPSAPFV